MKTHLIFTFLISIMAFSCCDKDEENSDDFGNVVFYSNAQALLNCGPFDIQIMIGNDSIGVISEAYVEETQPNCLNSNSTLMIERKVGTYNYSAYADCGQYGSWSGELKVEKDGCVKIFLDLNESNQKND
ncbi:MULTISPECIES: hypothetical protein [unclassified Carboxylicivirga]|uniref:hypothetical protein n=1 Tax=Carboxylicivirga TaxID=1628153 RepID=UPI003D34159A